MRPLRFSINVSLDGCCDHSFANPDAELHNHAAASIAAADALILGRVTYDMMEEAWRPPAESGELPEWMEDWMMPFAHTIHAVKKYVVSSKLDHVDWNAELLRGDVVEAVRELKRQPGNGLYTGGVTLPQTLAEAGLIDEYEFVVHPVVVGGRRRLFEGLSKPLDLEPLGRTELPGGVVATRYRPRTD